VSERRAVYAHDPSVLAQLALRDAGGAAKLRPTWAEAYAAEVRVRGMVSCVHTVRGLRQGSCTRAVRARVCCSRASRVPLRGGLPAAPTAQRQPHTINTPQSRRAVR
jgi:hypothetical protein